MYDIQTKDFFEVRVVSVLGDYERQVITSLYQPIIGHIGLALYFSLWNLHELAPGEPLSHADFFMRMDINLPAFEIARRRLEAVGLMRTHLVKKAEFNYIYYELAGPKTAYDFFDDVLFKGMLIRAIGAKDSKRLAMSFKTDQVPNEGEDISASFMQVFHPDFTSDVFNISVENVASSRRTHAIVHSFEVDVFDRYLQENGLLNKEALSEEERSTILRYSTLYALNEETVGKCVLLAYNQFENHGSRLDVSKFSKMLSEEVNYAFTKKTTNKNRSLISSETETAKIMNLMSTLPPMEFLAVIQKNRKVADSDRRLIEELSLNFGLNPSVINALIFTVLSTQNNKLPYAYTTKIAGSLVRERIDNALDAINYLLKDNKKKTTKKTMSKRTAPIKTDAKVDSEVAPDMSEEELAQLRKMLEGNNGTN